MKTLHNLVALLVSGIFLVSCSDTKSEALEAKIASLETELQAYKAAESLTQERLIAFDTLDFEFYTNQKWDDAISTFNKCDKLEEKYIGRQTTPCKVYISRCEEFKINSPGKDWDGSWTLTEK